jgi:hypothetical protein
VFYDFQPAFPDSIFDNGTVPSTSTVMSYDESNKTLTAQADTVVLLGLELINPATDPLPATYTDPAWADHDGDGNPGVTCPAGEEGIGWFGLSSMGQPQASAIYQGLRGILRMSGSVTDCAAGRIEGTFTGSTDGSVVGCDYPCDQAQTDFLVSTTPDYQDAGGSTFSAVRISSADCATVRSSI